MHGRLGIGAASRNNGVTVLALGVIPAILWWVLKRWPGGKLAAVTNAAEA